MKPLIVLLGVFVASLLTTFFVDGEINFQLSGVIAMSAMLLFTAIGHFAFTAGMVLMLPEVVPFRTALVYFTGVLEILAAIGLILPAFRVFTGWFLVVFFILMLPANIWAAAKRVDYQKASFDGPGMNYLWFRVPLQLLFILWVYWFVLRSDT